MIPNVTAVRIVLSQTQRLRIQTARKRRRMPPPLRHRAERHRLLVFLRERLQARDIAGKRELSIAKRQRRQRVKLSESGIVTLDQCGSVNPGNAALPGL